MKRNAQILLTLLIATIFVACKKDKIENKSDFETSYRAWQKFKVTVKNNYSYTTTIASWTGHSSQTTITVLNGKVTRRDYIAKAVRSDQTHAIYIVDEWNENENTLNTHQSGSSTLTLDQIYELAKNEWLLKRANAKIFFEAKNNGLISSAGYVEDNCADDCFKGINISSIQDLNSGM